eukprot:CAMPEP_0174241254 /NCGR_PEP_ID=MMETSP0417-20130205/22442_1 /TAXON_ID=242541 /ORGANISM="Mayorella sp, Strain BSH-02190019" /LENGTH=452 /DNA_ID=CAMNT_0015320463 /DNA_START=62 /DNA_END=1417 /DNA_ORIENTATION=+
MASSSSTNDMILTEDDSRKRREVSGYPTGDSEKNSTVTQQASSLPASASKAAVRKHHPESEQRTKRRMPPREVETDEHRLLQRQRQIDFGKNTAGYANYLSQVPKSQRTREHPRTPDKTQVCSKRSWDGQVRKWRRLLHEFDTAPADDEEEIDMASLTYLADAESALQKVQSAHSSASATASTSASAPMPSTSADPSPAASPQQPSQEPSEQRPFLASWSAIAARPAQPTQPSPTCSPLVQRAAESAVEVTSSISNHSSSPVAPSTPLASSASATSGTHSATPSRASPAPASGDSFLKTWGQVAASASKPQQPPMSQAASSSSIASALPGVDEDSLAGCPAFLMEMSIKSRDGPPSNAPTVPNAFTIPLPQPSSRVRAPPPSTDNTNAPKSWSSVLKSAAPSKNKLSVSCSQIPNTTTAGANLQNKGTSGIAAAPPKSKLAMSMDDVQTMSW